ncbi:Uncharacterised protein [Mycobacteroides abscessus subsp. abscessus]|nr:Uncharacterised protein [Mycobacteroides abscessus subsp. abscessus]
MPFAVRYRTGADLLSCPEIGQVAGATLRRLRG